MSVKPRTRIMGTDIKLLFWLVIAACTAMTSETKAQSGTEMPRIECIQAGLCSADTEYGDEWQYLTTDLYLMNMDRMEALLADPKTGKLTNRRRRSVSSLFISAQLLNTSIGGLEIPLYNYVLDDRENKMSTTSTDKMNIIDNVPLTKAGGEVKANIRMEVVPKSDPDFIDRFVEVGSKFIANPSFAGMASFAASKLTGELQNLQRSKGRKYVFNSVISLYESIKSERRIHSIGIYEFTPGGHTAQKLTGDEEDKLKDMVSSGGALINKQSLMATVQSMEFPFVVVVNSVTRYSTQVDPRTIDDKALITRKSELEKAYENKAIFQSLYDLECKLNDYLEKYVNFKDIHKAYKSTNDDNNLANVIIKYDELKEELEEAKELSGGKEHDAFENVFCEQYDKVFNRAKEIVGKKGELHDANEVLEIMYKCTKDEVWLENDDKKKMRAFKRKHKDAYSKLAEHVGYIDKEDEVAERQTSNWQDIQWQDIQSPSYSTDWHGDNYSRGQGNGRTSSANDDLRVNSVLFGAVTESST